MRDYPGQCYNTESRSGECRGRGDYSHKVCRQHMGSTEIIQITDNYKNIILFFLHLINMNLRFWEWYPVVCVYKNKLTIPFHWEHFQAEQVRAGCIVTAGPPSPRPCSPVMRDIAVWHLLRHEGLWWQSHCNHKRVIIGRLCRLHTNRYLCTCLLFCLLSLKNQNEWSNGRQAP